MKRENFTASASRAIDEGNRERQATAQRLALQFGAGANGFDLNSLARLGEAGLAAFLSSLGNQNPFPNWREGKSAPDANLSPVLEAGGDFGWAILRSREPRWFVRAVVRGWAAGFVLATIGSIILRFVEQPDNDDHQGQEIPRPGTGGSAACGLRRHDRQFLCHRRSRAFRESGHHTGLFLENGLG